MTCTFSPLLYVFCFTPLAYGVDFSWPGYCCVLPAAFHHHDFPFLWYGKGNFYFLFPFLYNWETNSDARLSFDGPSGSSKFVHETGFSHSHIWLLV